MAAQRTEVRGVQILLDAGGFAPPPIGVLSFSPMFLNVGTDTKAINICTFEEFPKLDPFSLLIFSVRPFGCPECFDVRNVPADFPADPVGPEIPISKGFVPVPLVRFLLKVAKVVC